MKLLLLLIAAGALCGCEASFPIGEGGRYGEAYVGYRLPANPIIVSEAPLYRDK